MEKFADVQISPFLLQKNNLRVGQNMFSFRSLKQIKKAIRFLDCFFLHVYTAYLRQR